MSACTHIHTMREKDTFNDLSCALHFYRTISAALLYTHSPFSVCIFSAAWSLLVSRAVKSRPLAKRLIVGEFTPLFDNAVPLLSGLPLTLADPLAHNVTYCDGARSAACLSICLTWQGVCRMICKVRVSRKMKTNQNAITHFLRDLMREI